MPSGGDQSPPPPPPPPAAAASDEEEEDDGEAEDTAPPNESPTPQIQQRFDELCSRLNMDEAARAEAWDSYRSMSESYTLEVRSQAEGRFRPSRRELVPSEPRRAPRETLGRVAGSQPGEAWGPPLRYSEALSRYEGEPALAALPRGFRMGNAFCPKVT